MSIVCEKLSSNFSVSWDPEILTKNFPVFSSNNDKPYSLSDGTPHWQHFPKTNIMFSRNMHYQFKSEFQEVINKLEILLKNINLTCFNLKFLSNKLTTNNLALIRIPPTKHVCLHKDLTRKFCINIGLKNSNKWETVISVENNIYEFEKNKTINFKIEDGDVYILNINNPHYVKCLDMNNLTDSRYILSYTYC